MLLVTGGDSHIKVMAMFVGKLQLNLYKRRTILGCVRLGNPDLDFQNLKERTWERGCVCQSFRDV